jgi:hypothetical protein
VDLLVLGDMSPPRISEWLKQIPPTNNPKLILEFWDPYWILKDTGPMAKVQVTQWLKLGYRSSCQTISGLQVGGVVDRTWLVVARIGEPLQAGWVWPKLSKEAVSPMSNCLRPMGIPKAAYRTTPLKTEVGLFKTERDAMPYHPGTIIATSKGNRQLLNDELAKGLSVPSKWLEGLYPEGTILRDTISLHILESLSPLLVNADEPPHQHPPDPSEPAPDFPQSEPDDSTFVWTPPNLSEGSAWNKQSALNLIAACRSYPNPGPMIKAGLVALCRHRSHYTATHPDPTYLQLLWWEFPCEHWDDLRNGSSMNFL